MGSKVKVTGKRLLFFGKSRFSARKKLFVLQFFMQSHNISLSDRTTGCAYRLSKEFWSDAPWPVGDFLNWSPPDREKLIFQKFLRLNGTPEHSETYTHFVRFNEYYKEKIWPLTPGVKGHGHRQNIVIFRKITIFRSQKVICPIVFNAEPQYFTQW